MPTARLSDPDGPPRPEPLGTVLCLLGLAATAFFLQGRTPVDVARFGAWGVLISIGVSVVVDLRRGIQNVIRTDLIALTSLYFLTLTEFLVSQKQYNEVAGMGPTHTAVTACIIAYAGLIIGRHLVSPKRKNPLQSFFQQPVPSSVLFSIFWACILVGYLNMLIAVKFNIFEMVDYFMQPRFTQPWQRGRFGDWMAMLYEMSMILYLVPPLGGILLARRKKHSRTQVFLVMLGVLFTLFYGFSSGTRNIFASYLVTFLIGYCFAAGIRQTKEIVIITVLTAVALVASTKVMLDFRDVGLKDYITEGYYKDRSNTQVGQGLAVDNNLYAISRMVEYFPSHHPYTGMEIPYLALIHPIPRVLWPEKPTGMSITVEDVFGATDWTVATSVVGEEYIMGGYFAVFFMSVFFGLCCAWWNLLASPKNSEFGILVYASGFFSAVITMRSMNWFSTALLPTLAGLVLGYLFMRYHKNKAAKAPPPVPRRKIASAPR
ncbi:MAG TPA: O-antigen polymerase [Chthoniobacteraceae bacterium]|jgi:oligosaccharide repeat unit polymerase|nr:O-antigen polymerase [Chthoniobacteraceae bacterium]